jgi:hypothetical protein
MQREALLTGILVVMETRQMELLAAEPHTEQVVVEEGVETELGTPGKIVAAPVG